MLPRDCHAPDRRPYGLTAHTREASLREISTTPCFVSTAADFNNLETSLLLNALVDALPNGLMVLGIDRTLLYWNQNAQRLCQKLASTQRYWTTLPTIVAELCHQVATADATTEPMLLEYQAPDYRSYRLTACWLTTGSVDRPNAMFSNQTYSNQTYILVTIEDRDEVLQQDIQIEQKKFHLTKREAEIWLLLKQEYTYQAIASTLHISLNTVKTHVRNIHAKRHPYQAVSA